MPTGSSSGAGERSSAAEPPPSGRAYSRLASRVRYAAPWAAGLIVIGGCGAFLALHQSAPTHPRAQTAYCGLVACAVWHSDASTSRAPSATASSRPSRSTRDAAAIPPAPQPTPTPTPAPTQPPAPTPDPTHTWPPPDEGWPPPDQGWPPPDQGWPPPDQGWPWHHHHDYPW